MLTAKKLWAMVPPSPRERRRNNQPTKKMIETTLVHDSVLINIREGNTIRNEECEIIRIFHAYYPSGFQVCEVAVYADGTAYSSTGDEIGKLCAAAILRRLGIKAA